MKSIKKLVATLVMTAAMIGGAVAQDQSPQQGQWNGPMMGTWGSRGMMGYGGMWPMMGGSGSLQAMCSAMASHVDGRLAYIKAELKITSAQESLWNSYADAARDNANAMITRCTTRMSQRGGLTVSLPDRLDQHETFLAAQLDAVRAMNKALKPLYAAFSDNQKKAADQLFGGPMGMM